MRKCWILSNAFSVSIKTVMWFLPQVHWCAVCIDLFTLSSPWTSEMKPTRSQQMILSVCSWIQSANILLRISALMFRKIILKLYFFVVSLSDFDMRVIIASLEEFAVFLFFFFCVWKVPYPPFHFLEMKQICSIVHFHDDVLLQHELSAICHSSWTRNSKICQSKLTSSIHKYVIQGMFVTVTQSVHESLEIGLKCRWKKNGK